MSGKSDGGERHWQNWDVGDAARVIDDYWLESAGEHESRELLARDIGKTFGSGGSIFEVGCGTGLMARELIAQQIVIPNDYSGGDVSQSMLAIARQRAPELRLRSLDIFDLSNIEPQDNVVCLHVLQHLPHYRTALAELIRLAQRQLYIATWFSASGTDEILMSRDSAATPSFYTNQYGLPEFLAETLALINKRNAMVSEWPLIGPTRVIHVAFRPDDR